MLRSIISIVLLSLMCSSYAQNLETVLKKTNKALGVEYRKGIKVLKTNGHFVMSGTETKIPFKLIQAKPDKIRVESTIFGFKAIQSYDGNTAWMLTPTQGMEAKKVDSRDMEFIAAATALEGPFSVNKSGKYTLQYEGEKQLKGKTRHLLTWYSEKEKLKYYINTATWLVELVRYEYEKNGGWYSMEYKVKSYMNYEGAKFPKEISALVNGVEMIDLTITKISEREEIDPGKFGKPSF